MRRAVLTAIIVSLVAPAGAAGHTVVTPLNPTVQSWVDEARVPTPDMTVEVVYGNDCEALGCMTGESTIELMSFANKATFLHELGHVFDFRYLTDEMRGRFIVLFGGDMPWWAANEDESAAEWFAEAYMQCARLHRIDPRWPYSVGSGLLVGRKLRKACWLIRTY